MGIISKLLVMAGALITVIGNIVAFYASSVAVHGVENAANEDIANVAWGLNAAYFWNFVALVGCVILIFGFIFSIFGTRNIDK
jgi:hypothetical protein